MTGLRRVGIVGIGSAVPDRILSNADLETMVDTSDEWITTRTGIKERRICGTDECTSTLAVLAAQRALENADLNAGDIDLILVATVTPDFPLPATSCVVQRELGAQKAGALDLMAACSGFIYAVCTGYQFIATGQCNRVLIIGADALSKIVDYDDRTSCILFGDAAGAVILSGEFEHGEVSPFFDLSADGRGEDVIKVKAGGSRQPMSHEAMDQHEQFMTVRGREVYKFAVTKFVELVREQVDRHPQDELGIVIPHQVNQRIIDSARQKLELPESKVYTNIDRFGNTSAASIPLAFDEVIRGEHGTELAGKLIVCCAFGAGLTWASMAIRW